MKGDCSTKRELRAPTPRKQQAKKQPDLSTRKEPRKAARKQYGVNTIRPKKLPKKELQYFLKMTKIAVDFYNENHEGDEIELVELLVVQLHSRLDAIAHINFMAKPLSIYHPDPSPKLFFAEMKSIAEDEFQATTCVNLDSGYVNRCSCCHHTFGVAHPPNGGFRGHLPSNQSASK